MRNQLRTSWAFLSLTAEEKEQLVTKDFLRAEMEALKSELIKWNVGAMAVHREAHVTS
ncbi:MAG: hypothetical protein ACREX9_01165 [Gammaproteobacteria bacterium]